MTRIDRVIFPRSPLVQNALAILAETSKIVGEGYFPVLVEALARSLSVRWVFVGKFDRADPTRSETIAFWDNGPAENFSYSLENTPCANVASDSVCCFPDNICDLFPDDQLLIDMGARSYAGMPLRAADGRVLGLVAVLDEEPFSDPEAVENIIALFSGRAAAELERLATRSVNEQLGRIVEASVSEAFVFNGDSYQFELVNRGARQNLGYTMEELRTLTPWDIKPEFSKDEFLAFLQPLISGEEETLVFETVHVRKDGSTYPVCVQLQYFPDVGNVFFASITDETEKKKQEDHERLILREMSHRAKNVLAIVQVLARQTVKNHPEDYLASLEARIAALSASHDILIRNEWKAVPLQDLVRSQLAHFRDLLESRIQLSGPHILLTAQAAQGFGLALHELGTNAAKYGALSNADGIVTISWQEICEGGEQVFELTWKEAGGPEVIPSETKGFGSFLIEKGLSSQFGADVRIAFDRTGIVARFRAPCDRVQADEQR
ncbi:HWE histidine kinase domain-containing protein [Aurantiacibacter odishensis]|uniref:HWE histidine kinase domain-containing protein n=1 Tax=Aurantiacibacter odishensis TaxID=1155476 RepID=UPI000E707C64|nr:HWE histidine kinase domain-containing protein [Aurantiacibacter odishensis]